MLQIFHRDLGDRHGQLLLLLVEHQPDGVEIVGEAAVVVGVGHVRLPAQLAQLSKLLLLTLHLVPQSDQEQIGVMSNHQIMSHSKTEQDPVKLDKT